MKNVRAKKHLGQHFLNDERIAFDITDLLSEGTKNVVEIGPGMGVLTQFLVKKEFKTEVVEIDTESVFYLRMNYPKLKIHDGDFLQLNLKEKYSYNFSLIGNFPYNISSQILFKAFENRDQIPEVVGMFQKEVAERIACKKGKKRGILSVFLQAFYDIEYCFTVNEDVFTPPPKVKSGVIKLVRNNRKELPVDEQKFKRVVKAGFNQRRKTLKNALKPFTLINESEIAYLLPLRAEQLSVDDFIKLCNHVG
ncbi:16S rRNA (adenine(1518)-N(6)/adenine(1519)-N(6))-dimethyltransferase RsmA [Flavobacteriales bacterium]|nr:16S rRNA (adenine(1518)-N(6)/adenine(1519)-N(6))-dimethyltransferase RsmA [Flavobacteriales bacterium]MDG1348484.1 16S rRNA (adenine(1518)-N(6)/adenine(1519)-N(6))-dimethyltransferase RsmA [Flavobacteriales bacterium]